jgi:alkylation response protein AidB-like acyl-CoA dehydrogenase
VSVQPAAHDLTAYRRGLHGYLTTAAELAGWRGVDYPTTEDRITHHAQLMGELYRSGWNRYGWPIEAGGLGGDERHRAVLYDALSAADLPVPEPYLMLETLGPPLLRFAPPLAAEYLPAYLRGEEWWGQGFSEPEAGSDLAALRTRATRDGEVYRVNGQKIWTSHGATARRLVCLVRTGSPAERHRGLTMLLVDVDSPGVTVGPIALASGRNELAEVYFDGVEVPASRLVGAEGQGWAVAMYLLQFERAMFAWLSAAVALRRLRELSGRLTDALLPDGSASRLGACYADLIALRARSAATVRRLAAGEPVGPEASVDKILLSELEVGLHDLARDLPTTGFLFGGGASAGTWRAEWWYSRAATIMGGSAEVQRTILADHVLDLPRERGA